MCRGSSVVERRPEKAGVASSILAPGTIHTGGERKAVRAPLERGEEGERPVRVKRPQRGNGPVRGGEGSEEPTPVSALRR